MSYRYYIPISGLLFLIFEFFQVLFQWNKRRFNVEVGISALMVQLIECGLLYLLIMKLI